MSFDTLKELIAKEEGKVKGTDHGTGLLRKRAVAKGVESFLKDHDVTTVSHVGRAVLALAKEGKFHLPQPYIHNIQPTASQRTIERRKREDSQAYGGLANQYIKESPVIKNIPFSQALDLPETDPDIPTERRITGEGNTVRTNTTILYLDRGKLRKYMKDNFTSKTERVEVVTVTFPEGW